MMMLLAKATAAVLLGLGATRLLPHSRASVRHLVLAATFVSLLTLPVAAALVPTFEIEVDVPQLEQPSLSPAPVPMRSAPQQATQAVGRAAATEPPAAPSRAAIAGGVWAAGVGLLLASFGVALWRLSRLRRRGVPALEMRALMSDLSAAAGIRRPVDVMFHEDLGAPLTFGVLRPAVLLPSDARSWPEADVRRALVHELEHVRRGDWTIQLLGRVVCAVYWFHPLVWMAWRRLCLEAERACDDAVVQANPLPRASNHEHGTANRERGTRTGNREQGTGNADYAEQLVALAQRARAHAVQPGLAMASRSDLSSRVSALLDASQRRGRVGVLSATAVVTVMAVFAVGLASVRTVRAASPRAEVAADGAAGQLRSGTGQGTGRGQGVGQGQAGGRVGGGERRLYRASERGDSARIEELLNAGANVNAAIDGDGSPLIGGVRSGKVRVVGLLLDRGADPNLGVEGDGSPLIVAAKEGLLEIVELLLDRGANPNLGVEGDGSPLIAAANEGHLAIAELLLNRGANVDLVVPGDENPLIQASGEGHLDVVQLLVTRGANVNARVWAELEQGNRRDGEWRTPLNQARKGRHDAVVSYLMSAGARE